MSNFKIMQILSIRPLNNFIIARNLSTYKSWSLDAYSKDFESLSLREEANTPVIKSPKEVLVHVKAASVNPIDLEMARGFGGKLFRTQQLLKQFQADRITHDYFPLTLGRDFSGVITNKGSRVSNYEIGDEVWGSSAPSNNCGSHATHIIVKESELTKKPKNINHVEAASIPYAGLTVWSALNTIGGLNESNSHGKRVLILGGTGGIGIIAIQLLKFWGAEVTATCSKDAFDWLKERTNVDNCLDYRSSDLSQATNSFDLLLDATPIHDGIDAVAFNALKTGGKYLTLNIPILDALDKGLAFGTLRLACLAGCNIIEGVKLGKKVVWSFYQPSQNGLQGLRNLVEIGAIKPVIDETFSFKDVPECYKKVQRGHSRGKTVIDMDQKLD